MAGVPLIATVRMKRKIRKQVLKRKITRLCHFTPSRNLRRILKCPQGLLSTDQLRRLNKKFIPTDIKRLDGHTDHVCCSVQYPNSWYLRQVAERQDSIVDWVVLLLCPSYLWQDGTKFCDKNAAAGSGRRVRTGRKGFNALFADQVPDGETGFYTRDSKPLCVPTDDQAEVLIPDHVDRDAIVGLVFPSNAQAKRELTRLKKRKLPTPRTLIAPTLFRPEPLSRTLRSGRLPKETVYDHEDSDG